MELELRSVDRSGRGFAMSRAHGGFLNKNFNNMHDGEECCKGRGAWPSCTR